MRSVRGIALLGSSEAIGRRLGALVARPQRNDGANARSSWMGFDGAAKGSVLGVGGRHDEGSGLTEMDDGKQKLGRQRSSKSNPRKSNSLGARCALMGLGEMKRATG